MNVAGVARAWLLPEPANLDMGHLLGVHFQPAELSWFVRESNRFDLGGLRNRRIDRVAAYLEFRFEQLDQFNQRHAFIGLRLQ